MARTTVVVDISDETFGFLKAGADQMDVSIETYLAVVLERHDRQERRRQAAPANAQEER